MTCAVMGESTVVIPTPHAPAEHTLDALTVPAAKGTLVVGCVVTADVSDGHNSGSIYACVYVQ